MQAPWTLNGNGFMFAYIFDKKWVNESLNVPDFLKEKFSGHLGTLMLVDYATSGVGAYKEFLFIPGKFHFQGKKYQSISHIYVSSQESVEWGRKNWGIPKFYADFQIDKIADNQEKWTISVEGQVFFEIELQWKKWYFPISTALVPIKVVQENFFERGRFFLTAPSAKGKGSLCKILSLKINPNFFPDINNIKPLISLKVSNFEMTFPIPEIV